MAKKGRIAPTLTDQELQALADRYGRGETSFEEEVQLWMALGSDEQAAGLQASLGRGLGGDVHPDPGYGPLLM